MMMRVMMMMMIWYVWRLPSSSNCRVSCCIRLRRSPTEDSIRLIDSTIIIIIMMMMIVSNDYCDNDEDGDGGTLLVTVTWMNDYLSVAALVMCSEYSELIQNDCYNIFYVRNVNDYEWSSATLSYFNHHHHHHHHHHQYFHHHHYHNHNI